MAEALGINVLVDLFALAVVEAAAAGVGVAEGPVKVCDLDSVVLALDASAIVSCFAFDAICEAALVFCVALAGADPVFFASIAEGDVFEFASVVL